jgi:hypothetical protein
MMASSRTFWDAAPNRWIWAVTHWGCTPPATTRRFNWLAFGRGDFLQEAGVVLALGTLEPQALKEGHGLPDRAMEHQQPANKYRALSSDSYSMSCICHGTSAACKRLQGPSPQTTEASPHVHMRDALDGIFGGGMLGSCSGGRRKTARKVEAHHGASSGSPQHTHALVAYHPTAVRHSRSSPSEVEERGSARSPHLEQMYCNMSFSCGPDMPGGRSKAAHLSLINIMSRTQREIPGCTWQTRGLGLLIWQACAQGHCLEK